MISMAESIANLALEMGAVQLQPNNPFTWASGYRMPIYNDNRTFLQSPHARKLIASGFEAKLHELGYYPRVLAGTATAGIPHATTFADLLGLPLTYIRSGSKDHGMGNKIEGLPGGSGYNGAKVLIIEDLISTGGSSIAAVDAARSAGGDVEYCFSIFTYGFAKAYDAFAALDPLCTPVSLLDYPTLIRVALERGYITQEQKDILDPWQNNPFEWGEKNGFPKHSFAKEER